MRKECKLQYTIKIKKRKNEEGKKVAYPNLCSALLYIGQFQALSYIKLFQNFVGIRINWSGIENCRLEEREGEGEREREKTSQQPTEQQFILP